MSRINGVVVGLVRDVEDPQQLGRVQVYFPWLADENQSQWARVATLMSGSGRGSWFMPELEDEVLVAFEQGDVEHPYIVGFLWNGQDKPPNDGIDTKVRRLKTVTGHTVEFDDRPGKERILIKSKGEHQIEMNDRPGEERVLIQTKGGHQIELKDEPGTLHIDTKGGQKVDLDDAPPKIALETSAGNSVTIDATGVTISAPAGTLSVNCLSATVNASATLSVNAPMATFSGVVQVTTLIATSVVSTSYTPGAGNIW